MESTRSLRRLVTGIGLVTLVLALVGAMGMALDILLRLPSISLLFGAPLGTGVIAIGILIEALCIRVLWHKGGGTPNPSDPPRRLVTVGPYRFSRNPLYLARLTILLGLAIFLGSLGILVMSALLLGGIHFVMLPGEEKRLADRFGQTYLEYKSRVPRWISLRRR